MAVRTSVIGWWYRRCLGPALLVTAVACGGGQRGTLPGPVAPESGPQAPAAAPTPYGSPPAGAPEARPSTEEGTGVEMAEAERSLAQAQSDFEAVLAGEGKEERAAAMKSGPPGCLPLCRALASLRRSSEAICRLTDQSERWRCERARAVVADGERRANGCPC
jgi:hypothetical protein